MSTITDRAGQGKAGRPSDRTKRAAILDAATASFFAHGYAATSIEQVALDAGVSKVTVYNHFGDKRALFSAAVERECEKMRGHFSIRERPGSGIRERLRETGEALVAFLSRPEMVQFERRIAAETETDSAMGEAFLEAGPRRMKRALAEMLEQASLAGELSIADPALAAEQFASLCKGMGDLERRFGAEAPGEDGVQRIEGALDVFLAAYGSG